MMNESKKSSTVEQSSTDQFNEFFGGILKQFGTTVPQFSAIIIIVFGTLGFNQVFNAGAFTLVALFCFGVVYLVRRQISANLCKSLIWALIIFLILAGIGPVLLYYFKGAKIWEWIKLYNQYSTAYVSLWIMLPIALIILSYQKQEKTAGIIYPPVLQKAIERQLLQAPFYKSQVKYIIKFQQFEEDRIILETQTSYRVKNQSREEKEWVVHLWTNDTTFTLVSFESGNGCVFIQDKKFLRNNGLKYPQMLAPNEEKTFAFTDQSSYPINGHELYTTFDPATDLSVEVHNPFQDIELTFEFRYNRYSVCPPVEHQDNVYRWSITSGIMPYQGLLVKWKPKQGGTHD